RPRHLSLHAALPIYAFPFTTASCQFPSTPSIDTPYFSHYNEFVPRRHVCRSSPSQFYLAGENGIIGIGKCQQTSEVNQLGEHGYRHERRSDRTGTAGRGLAHFVSPSHRL